MNIEKTHVYFVPGLAAGKEIFWNISLSKEKYTVHVLEWLIPEKSETLKVYAQRMAARVVEPNSVLIGVSFGGVVAQEMSVFLKLKKLIIISSVKTKHELPARMKWVRMTKAYKLLPTSLILSVEDLTKFAVGPKTKKRLSLYQHYLHVRDKQYLDWAIEKMVNWERGVSVDGIIHIQGDHDPVFPIKNISDCTVIVNGTHIMILNRGREISKKILHFIEQ